MNARATGTQGQRAMAASLTRLLAVWLILLVGVLQAGTVGHAAVTFHRQSDAIADLSSAIGEEVILCAHALDQPGKPSDPSHDGDGCDHCPLCQVAYQAGFIVPNTVAVVERQAKRLPTMRAWAEVRLNVRLILVRGRSRAPPAEA